MQMCFKRYELKFLISSLQYTNLLSSLLKRMNTNEYSNTLICNIYYDTPDFYLIRKSLEKPIYKEKLRLRSYDIPSKNSNVFLELKKKYNSVVYKRRTVCSLNEVDNILNGTNKTQIEKEISYFYQYYKDLEPRMFLSYHRFSLFGIDNPSLRITFDTDITYRDYDLDLTKGTYGNKLIKDQILMEIKTDTTLPLWLSQLLTENKIYQSSFSKYGQAYLKGDKQYVI